MTRDDGLIDLLISELIECYYVAVSWESYPKCNQLLESTAGEKATLPGSRNLNKNGLHGWIIFITCASTILNHNIEYVTKQRAEYPYFMAEIHTNSSVHT